VVRQNSPPKKHTTHELGFFEIYKTLAIMKKAGFQTKFLKKGLMKDRGLFVGVKQ
jgi:hypothetical protein